eukprot:11155507-Lingulodinium_polyedra.AAC.1
MLRSPPVLFILENVPALASDFSDVFGAIISALQSMAGPKYEVNWDLRNTQVHGGPHKTALASTWLGS